MPKAAAIFKHCRLLLSWLPFATAAQAEAPMPGQPAPLFQLKTQDGSNVSLADRRGQGWTVLYFYPKAGTPGCTKQACAFRDSLQLIRARHAEVFGISTDSVAELAAFHAQHRLTFTLLSDPEAQATDAYGVKMPILALAKRRTFIVDPQLIIRRIDDDVDPAMDPQHVAAALAALQAETAP